MLLYFWQEKGDPKRWVGYDEWAKLNPEKSLRLEYMLADYEEAGQRISRFLSKEERES